MIYKVCRVSHLRTLRFPSSNSVDVPEVPIIDYSDDEFECTIKQVRKSFSSLKRKRSEVAAAGYSPISPSRFASVHSR